MSEDPSGSAPDEGDDRDEESASIANAGEAARADDLDGWEWGVDRETDASIPVDVDESDSEDGSDEEYGPEPNSARIEPGTPKGEHVLFVVLGAVAMVLVIVRLASIFVAG